ncbi:glycosyltransferase family 4 protein [Flavobacterium sp. DSP2-3-1]|uniref:glycosyltransferase family 4 protein n=1 Tax=Flavobacterium sp. DSP2-3-1 TaxID=2804620 RepID=UPI003CEF7B10
MKKKLIRITTVPISLEILLENQLRFMNQHYVVVGVSSDKEYLKQVGHLEDIEVYDVEMTRRITPLLDVKAVWRLYRYFKKEKPFIVHTHTPKAGTLGMIAAKLAGVPNRLHTIAGLPLLETTGFKRVILNLVEKITYACATRIYPNSFGLKEIVIQERFCKPEKLKVIGNGSSNGINTAYFDSEIFSNNENKSLKSHLGISPEDFVFIFVGRLVGDKGINELIRAFKKLSAENTTVKLLLVGPLESGLDPLAPETLKEIAVNRHIISVGFQNDVRPYFAISNVLVFPSYREGFPNVVMQAGAMGLPSIVTDINGCNEIIIEGKNGIIIPVKDGIAVYKAMKKMVREFDFRNQLQQNTRRMIVSRYEQQMVWDAILAEYKNLEVTLSNEKIKNKLIRTSTVAVSLDYLLKGQLSFLQNNYEVLAVSGTDEHLDAVASREGVRVKGLNMQRKISIFKDLKSLWQLYWLFKKENPLIVHSITPKAGLLSMTAAYFAKVPIRMHTFTGLIFPTRTGFKQKLLIAMDKLLCQFATNIYPEGQGVKNDLIKFKVTTKPLNIIANGNVNGIDTAYFNPENFSAQQNRDLKNSLGIHAEDFVFIFVGRLVSDKGINELIKGFKKVSSERERVKLILVGPLESDLDPLKKETLQEIITNNKIRSVGFQKDVRPYLAISHCLTFPSYREGFPNVVMQAGAMGLPSIVTNINGCNEIIIEDENGAIIPVKDSNYLYQAMQKMADDINFRTNLQLNARAMIVSRYKQKMVWEAILAEYKRLEQNV